MLPYSLDLLSDCLADIRVPAEPFDPNGEWVHDYSIWNSARARNARSEPLGNLRIRRRLMPNGNIRLRVTEVAQMNKGNGPGIIQAVITCDANDLATPIQWKVDSEVLGPQSKQVPLTAIGVSNSADKTKVTGRISSNWSLLDAVQRLPFDSKTIEFTLLEELELVKPDQKLSAGQTAEVKLGGRLVKLHSFEQIGRGILPITYWLDERHRLIIATGGRRSYLLDSVGGGKE